MRKSSPPKVGFWRGIKQFLRRAVLGLNKTFPIKLKCENCANRLIGSSSRAVGALSCWRTWSSFLRAVWLSKCGFGRLCLAMAMTSFWASLASANPHTWISVYLLGDSPRHERVLEFEIDVGAYQGLGRILRVRVVNVEANELPGGHEAPVIFEPDGSLFSNLEAYNDWARAASRPNDRLPIFRPGGGEAHEQDLAGGVIAQSENALLALARRAGARSAAERAHRALPMHHYVFSFEGNPFGGYFESLEDAARGLGARPILLGGRGRAERPPEFCADRFVRKRLALNASLWPASP